MHNYKLGSLDRRISKIYTTIFFLGTSSLFISSTPSRGDYSPISAYAKPSKYNTHITSFSISVPANSSCGLSYIDAMGEHKVLKFEGLANRDTTITQSIGLESSTAFVWGFLKPKPGKSGLSLTRFTVLANPGDKINLSLNKEMLLSPLKGEASALLADNTATLYSTLSFGKGGKKLSSNDSKAAYVAFNKTYYSSLYSAYQKEVDRLNGLKAEGKMDALHYTAANFYAKAFFYDKLFVLLDEGSMYPDLVLPFLKGHISEAEKLLKAPNPILSGEVMRVMTGVVNARLMAKNIDVNNFLNLYEEGKNLDLGVFKSTFLTYCLAGYPAKQLASYKSAVSDFGQRYAESEQSYYLNALIQKSSKALEFPRQEKFTTSQNGTFTINDIVDKAATQFVVVDFWASWCAPCRQQFPVIDSLKRVFKSQSLPVTFVSINMDDDKKSWFKAEKDEIRYLQQNSYHLENARKSGLVKTLSINAIPHTVVLKDGKIIANNFTLPVELSFTKDLTALINQQKTAENSQLYTSRQ